MMYETEAASENEAYERLKVARNQERPYTLDYIERLFENFTELHGDRHFADDSALVAGTALFRGVPVVVMGQQKGRSTNERKRRNFGMPKPEGYRKALRAMKLAEKFGRPVICLIDTPGAYPGVDAEEHNQSEAIARNLLEMAALKTPIIAAVIGEGGSGGALALGVCDRALMMENAVYSVISPEGCAAILWKDASQSALAAKLLRLTADDLYRFKLIDEVVREPEGGAHADHAEAARLLGEALSDALQLTRPESVAETLLKRHQRLRRMGEMAIV